MPMKKSKKFLTKWRDGNYHVKGLEEKVRKMSVLPKPIYRFDAVPFTILSTFL